MSQAQFANAFVNRRAKAASLLNHVAAHGMRPAEMNAATVQVWDAAVFVGLIHGSDSSGWIVTPGGNAFREVFNRGEDLCQI